jgi:small subunit ribosomal protein S21
MFQVKLRKDEPIDRALKRLKGKIDADGMMEELKRLRSYETPQQRKKRKLKSNHKKEKIARQNRLKERFIN